MTIFTIISVCCLVLMLILKLAMPDKKIEAKLEEELQKIPCDGCGRPLHIEHYPVNEKGLSKKLKYCSLACKKEYLPRHQQEFAKQKQEIV